MSSTTETEICNRALGRIAEARIISLDDASAAARACKLHFEDTRDEVLRSHRWNFATERSSCSQLATPPAFGWSYRYALPSDFLRALEVNDTEDEGTHPWAVENGCIMSNEVTCRLLYIRREANVSKWDSLFKEAVSLKLASKLAPAIRGSSSQVQDLLTEYARVTAPLARRVDANEGRERKPVKPLRSMFVMVRRRGV